MLPDCLPATEQRAVWWTASPIIQLLQHKPPGKRSCSVTTRQKAAATMRGGLSRPPLWSCLPRHLFLHWSSCHYYHYRSSLLLLLTLAGAQSLKRSDPADTNELEAADRRGCSLTDTALRDKNSIFSKSDMGQDNYSFWYLWVACSCAVSHAQAHACTLDWLGLHCPFKLLQSLMKCHWRKWFIVGKRWLSLFASVDLL